MLRLMLFTATISLYRLVTPLSSTAYELLMLPYASNANRKGSLFKANASPILGNMETPLVKKQAWLQLLFVVLKPPSESY